MQARAINTFASVLAGALGVAFLWTAVRAFVHRVPAAQGDPELAATLQTLGGRRTRRLAVAVIDTSDEPTTRSAFIGAGAGTRFEIGSITKPLTGMLLADAIRRGEVSLDTQVCDIAPTRPASRFGSITLRELCTHTSGLPSLPRGRLASARALCCVLIGLDPYRGTTASRMLYLAAGQPLSDRGQRKYSNLGAAVLGQLLAIAAGTDYATLLRERILMPIGMTESAVSGPNNKAPRGWSSTGRRQQPWTMGGYAPAGAVVSTIEDMGRLAISLLKRSAPGCDSLMAIDGVETDGPNRATGMFWIIEQTPRSDRTLLWHNGQTGGYSGFFALVPETHRAVVVLANVASAAEQERIALAFVRSWADM